MEVTPTRFETDAMAAITSVRRALTRFIEKLNTPIHRAADLQKVLGVDKALGWQTFRAWTAGDPLEAAPFIPRPGPLDRILNAGRSRGVPASIVEEVAEACAAFESFVEDEAGDRETFESMIGGLAGSPPPNTLPDRRAAFRALGRLWGVHAHAQISCGIFFPRALPDASEAVSIEGYVGVQQLRRDVTLRVSVRSNWAGEAPLVSPQFQDSQYPHPDNGHVLLDSFCSRPLPTFATRQIAEKMFETTLEFNGIGRASAVTYFLRRVFRISKPPAAGDAFAVNEISRIPTKVLILNFLVPAGLTDPQATSASAFGNLYDVDRAWVKGQRDRLPITETTAYLGRSLERLHTPDFPRCPEMIGAVLSAMGWRDTEFDIYRCRIEYPILHAGFLAQVESAEAKSARAEPDGANP